MEWSPKRYSDRRSFLRAFGIAAALNVPIVDAGLPFLPSDAAVASTSRRRGDDRSVDPRSFGAKFDGVTDDSNAWQRAVDSLPDGGTLQCPPGASVVAGLRVTAGIAIRGAGGNRYGFSGTGGGTVLIHPDTTPQGLPVTKVVVSSGGSGYTDAPQVTLSGGGGTGATATASLGDGQVVVIRIVAPGRGYTSAPTVAISGGGGSGAVASAIRTSPIVYQASGRADGVSFSDLTLIGHGDLPTQGIVLSNAWFARFTAVDFYFVSYEALWIIAGAGPHVQDCQIFGGAQESPGNDPTGSLRIGIGCTDLLAANLEVGGEPSKSRSALPNAAVYVEGSAANFTNCVGEGADVGWRITGQNGRFVNCRGDINFGPGWLVTRDLPDRQRPQWNYINNCWAHNNSRYRSGGYDNFQLTSDALQTRISMCLSDATDPKSRHRFGLNDQGSGTKAAMFDDVGAVKGATSS